MVKNLVVEVMCDCCSALYTIVSSFVTARLFLLDGDDDGGWRGVQHLEVHLNRESLMARHTRV